MFYPIPIVIITDAEIELRLIISLICGLAEPLHCLGMVLFNAPADIIADAEIALRLGKTLFGGFAIPFHSLGFVLFDAIAIFIAGTEIVLRLGKTLFGGFAIPFHSLGIVLFDAIAIFMAGTEIELRLGKTVFRGFTVPFHGFRLILFDAIAAVIAKSKIALCHIFALFRGFSPPFHSFRMVLFDPLAGSIAGAEIVLRPGKALFRGFAEPFHSLGFVLFNTYAFFIAEAEIELRPGMALFRGFAIPFHRLFQVLFNAPAGSIEGAETVLRPGMALLGSLAVPFHGLSIVLFNTIAFVIADAEIVLRFGIPLFRGFAEPFHRLGIVLFNPIALSIANTETVLRPGTALLGSLAVPFHRLFEALFNASPDIIEIAEIVLCIGMPLIRSFAEPFCRLDAVLFNTLALVIAGAEIVLRLDMPLLGSFANPFHRLEIVLFNTFALVIADTEIILRLCIVLFGGFAEPFCRLGTVLFNVIIVGAETDLCLKRALFRSFAEPFYSLGIVLFNTRAFEIADTEIILRLGIALFRSFAEPFCRLDAVLFNTFPDNIGSAEIKLRLGRSLFRSLAIPFHRLDAVLFNAVAACIAGTEIELSLGQTLIRGFAEPFHRLGIVLFNASAMYIADAEIELCFGMALFGSRREILYRGFKILCLQCGLGFAKVLHACRFRFFRVFGFRFLVHFTIGGENKRCQDDREGKDKSPVENPGVQHGDWSFHVILGEMGLCFVRNPDIFNIHSLTNNTNLKKQKSIRDSILIQVMSPKWRTIFCMGDIERKFFLFLFFNLRIRIVLIFHWYGLYYRDTFFQRISINKGTSIMTDHIISNGNDLDFANRSNDELGALTVGETVTINETDYLLTNENGVLSVTVTSGDTPTKPKWTYLVYMAADNNLSFSALYDIVSIQQATLDSQIDIYVLADRSPAGTEGSGDNATINGTYRWDSDWEDTRVGKITYSPGLTVTVDWESWGELDTGSIETLERFVNWVQEESPADNYGLILWDHGREDAEFCWDLTTDPDWGAYIRVSEVSDLLKKKGNIPIVIFNACLFSSELVVTQMAGSTDVIVVSEPTSYGETITYNYNMFFRTITPDMTPQEMAAIMVRNVGPQHSYPGDPTMLTSIDVTAPRLAETLDALAEAVAAADNDADMAVLIQAMLKAPQNGSNYDGSAVQQSDLGFIIRDVMADPDYENTSEEFKKALADVKTALEEIVLEYRSMPANRGSGVAVFNPVYTIMVYLNNGLTPEEIGISLYSYLTSCYYSNPMWAALLNHLGATYLEEVEAWLVPTSVFSVSTVDGLVDGRIVSVSDIGCFSGWGEYFDGIKLHDEMFFGFVITAEDKSTGSFTVSNDADVAVMVSLLAADGTVVETGIGSVTFQDLAVGNYYLRIQSETDCGVTLCSGADWWTGVDRFDYAGSGQNVEHVNGNGSPEKATALATGHYSGLITCQGDTDYYLIADGHAPLYIVEVYGEEGWTVGEYDAEEGILHEADYSNGKYTLMMAPMSYLLVEGTADLANGADVYFLNVIESDLPVDVTLDHLVGTQDRVSWEPSILMNNYIVEYSMDGFEHTIRSTTMGTAVDLLNLPAGTYQWRVMADSEWFVGEEIVSDNTTAAPNVFRSNSDSNDDVFFATPNGTWSSLYCAKHVGSIGDWTGTGEMVSAAGKGRIQDLFFGSADPSMLCLTDSENGDALFLDDVYTGLPEEIEENTARLLRLREIYAGAGDDIVDMTSQRFEYTENRLFSFFFSLISGGDGDDVIWANMGGNLLFGDAGNDRIVGASGNDVIVGGVGNDSMHGGGGDDTFTFCENWGTDTVEQLADGMVTLWFLSGSMENWDTETLTYSDGENSVTVSGVSADQVTLNFGQEAPFFVSLYALGAFAEFVSKKIFDDTDNGFLASV